MDIKEQLLKEPYERDRHPISYDRAMSTSLIGYFTCLIPRSSSDNTGVPEDHTESDDGYHTS